MNSLTRLWQSIKNKFAPPPPPPPPPPRPDKSDSEYEDILLKLLEQAEQGCSWGNLEGFLIAKDMDKVRLAKWLQRFGAVWLEQPESHQELGQRLLLLAEVAQGELAEVARRLGESLGVARNRDNSASIPTSLTSEEDQEKDTPSEEQESHQRLDTLDTSASNQVSVPSTNIQPPIPNPQSSIPNPKSDGVQALIDQCIQQYQAGDYQGALASVISATKIYPNDHRSWNACGDWMIIFEQYEEAIASYDQALKLKPDLHEVWVYRGTVLYYLGQLEEALASYDQALKIQPDYYEAWFNRGLALDDLGQKEEAIASFDQVLKIKPDDHQAWYNRGNALDDLGQLEAALVSYDQALKIKPDYYEAWNNLGITLSNLGQLEKGLASYDQALKINPHSHLAWHNRGNALRKLGRYQEAIASYDQALKFKPDFYQAWDGRGSALDDLGRAEEAIASYDQALKINPHSHLAWFNRGLAAGRSLGYDPFCQQQFVALFRVEVSKAPQQLIPALETTDAKQFLAQLQASLSASTEQLVTEFADAPQLIAQIQQSPPPELNQLIGQPPPPQLIALIQQPLSEEVAAQLQQDSFFHPPRFNSQLNLRGYQGKLASLQAELDKSIGRDTHPEGWGFLHHEIGRAHYFQGRREISPFTLWRKAETSYKTALQVLKPPEFEELHLEVLQDLIRVLLDLHETEEAQELGRQGTDLLRRMLADPKRTDRQKRQLALKSAAFDQLTVDLTLQSGDVSGALELAEVGKNTCLRWLLGNEEVTPEQPPQPPNYGGRTAQSPPELGDLGGEGRVFDTFQTSSQIQELLNDTTAAIYWHLSPSRLTTFAILPDETVPVVVASGRAEEQKSPDEQRPASLLQLLAWEDWLKDWNEQYEDYGGLKGKKKGAQLTTGDLSAATETERDARGSKAGTKDHPWRTGMEDRLQSLQQILNIVNLKQLLQERAITNLILIPHRDLHRLPLHYLLDEFTCTYLPSVRVGLDLLGTGIKPPLGNLLLVQNPKSTPQFYGEAKPLAPLPFAEVEAALICQMFTNITSIENENAHHAQVQQALSQAHQLFHFTGHGAYNSTNPAQSCLFLSETDQLTLGDIVGLDLSAYQLVSLAACETAVTGNQTITDEYVGLVSAFLRAGVSQVLSTLWRVESFASTLLVVEFYQQLQGGKPPAAALKAAQDWLKTATREDLIAWLDAAMSKLPQESVLRQPLESRCRQFRKMEETAQPYSHPYYWAAFTISGL